MAAPSHPVKPGSSIASVKAQIRAFVESTADAEGYVHYLAYGSNMNSKVLSGRRKVFPVASKPCKCPGWVMRYASRGACYMEPAFGVIIPRPDNAPASEPDCHGVAHRITVDEFLQIVATEGGGGHPELGYSIVDVAVETTVEPKETIERVLTLGAGTKVRFDLLCSLRYKEIVVDGARQGNVDPAYIEYLESIPHYDTTSTLGRRMGRTLFLGIFGLFVLPAFVLTTKLKLEAGGTATYVLQRLWLSPIRRFTWFIHDHFLRHVLGSGANNDGLPQLPPLPLAGGVRVAVEPHHEATTEDSYIVVATAEAADPHIDGGNGDSK